jgi:undecaprenyl diphosphate synthase
MAREFAFANRSGPLPQHVAIIMDGNGRWALQRDLPRVAGHSAGVESVRAAVRAASTNQVRFLTLFAFGKENWNRPSDEVTALMDLFLQSLQAELPSLQKNNVRLRIVGDRAELSEKLRNEILQAEAQTLSNTGLQLILAINYSGRWDIVQAMQSLSEVELRQEQKALEAAFGANLVFAGVPDPDLFIRTSGEQRISNFMLWQLAYSEMYFSSVSWPDFNEAEFERALEWFASRERRFGFATSQPEGYTFA